MLEAELAAIVGTENVAADAATCTQAVADLFPFPPAPPAELVVRPRSTDETAAVMGVLAARQRAVVPRGAGMSYTAGGRPDAPVVVIDTARLTAIEIHAQDLYAVVGAGCSWQRVADELRPHGLRATQRNPISGAVSTVGGLAAQSIPGGTDGVLGVTVVLCDGTVARTGANFQRSCGPDLTGLFLGDCGAFGVKTEVVLRLAPEPACAFASFTYDAGDKLIDDVVRVHRRGIAVRAIAMDQARAAAATQVEAGDAARIVGATVREAGSAIQALRDVAALARGRRALVGAQWTLHLTAEGVDAAIATAQLAFARAECTGRTGEIDPVVPRALHAKPYSIRGFLSPDGARWVPVHGVLPLSAARDCFVAVESYLEANAAVERSWLVSSAGPYVTLEPMFFWPDALDPLHLAHLSERNRARFAGKPPNEPARAEVQALRAGVRELFAHFGATHAQLGRFYRYDGGALAERIKRALDPAGRMNPGVLGL